MTFRLFDDAVSSCRPLAPFLFVTFSLVLVATPVSLAATLAVTTTADVIAIDGQCSLREAVTAANTNAPFNDCPAGEAWPIGDVIELPVGTYSLTLGAAGDDANLGGDLDFTESVTLRGLGDPFVWWDDPLTPEMEELAVYENPDGFPRTFVEADLPGVIIENGLGDSAISGDGDRVIHVLPSALAEGLLPAPVFVFENLAIVGGDISCSGAACSSGAAGLLHEQGGELTLGRVAFFGNRQGCSGTDCGQELRAAALLTTADALVLDAGVLADNHGECSTEGCRAGRIYHSRPSDSSVASADLTNTLVVGNSLRCSAADCEAHEMVRSHAAAQRIEQVVFTGNEVGCSVPGFQCAVAEILDPTSGVANCAVPGCSLVMQDLEFSENRLSCDGVECDTDEVFDRSSFVSVTFVRARFRDNVQTCTGFACDVDEVVDLNVNDAPASSFTVSQVEVLDNELSCEGVQCDVNRTMTIEGKGIVTVENVFVRGDSTCVGDGCIAGSMVSVWDAATVSDLEVRDSLISCTGAQCQIRPLVDFLSREDGRHDISVDSLVVADNQALCSTGDCLFAYPLDPDDPEPSIEGGIVAFGRDSEQNFQVSGATITGNTTSAPGVIGNRATLEITSSVISANTSALGGGALYNGSPIDAFPMPVPGSLVLRDSLVRRNMAGTSGGGILNASNGNLALYGTTVAANTAMDGGGIYNQGTILARQSGTVIEGNMPDDCLDVGDGTGCALFFADGFESGDTSAWFNASP